MPVVPTLAATQLNLWLPLRLGKVLAQHPLLAEPFTYYASTRESVALTSFLLSTVTAHTVSYRSKSDSPA